MAKGEVALLPGKLGGHSQPGSPLHEVCCGSREGGDRTDGVWPSAGGWTPHAHPTWGTRGTRESPPPARWGFRRVRWHNHSSQPYSSEGHQEEVALRIVLGWAQSGLRATPGRCVVTGTEDAGRRQRTIFSRSLRQRGPW